jgi:hypothetical protein
LRSHFKTSLFRSSFYSKRFNQEHNLICSWSTQVRLWPNQLQIKRHHTKPFASGAYLHECLWVCWLAYEGEFTYRLNSLYAGGKGTSLESYNAAWVIFTNLRSASIPAVAFDDSFHCSVVR